MPELHINSQLVTDITLGGQQVLKIEDSQGTVLYEAGPKFFTLTNTFAGPNTLTIGINGTPASTDLEYSLDGVAWTSVDLTLSSTQVQVPEGGAVRFRSSTGFSKSYGTINLSMTGSHTASGDIRTLFDYTDVDSVTAIPNNGLSYLFNGNTHITDLSGVDFSGITSIGDYGLNYACFGCTALTTAPNLASVTVLGEYGLYTAFQNCTSLASAPDIRSLSTIGNNAFAFMCYGCSNLTTAYMPDMTTWTTGDYGTTRWLENTSASGVIWKNAALNKTAQELGCPSGWTTQDYN